MDSYNRCHETINSLMDRNFLSQKSESQQLRSGYLPESGVCVSFFQTVDHVTGEWDINGVRGNVMEQFSVSVEY